MNFRRRTIPRSLLAGAVALAVAAGLVTVGWVGPSLSSADPSLGQLSQQLGAEQAHQQSLASSISSLSSLISSLDGQISLVQSREAAVRADLVRDRAALAKVEAALTREEHLLAVLKQRLGWARMLLSRQLVSNYEQAKPNLVSVVLESNGFNALLDNITYLRDAQNQQQRIIAITRTAKAQANAAAVHLTALRASDRQITIATTQRVLALASMNQLLESREGALAQARIAQQNALAASRARGAALAGEIAQIQAEQAAAERAALRRRRRRLWLADSGRTVLRRRGQLDDPVLGRAVRVRRPGPDAKQRGGVGLLPVHARHLGRLRRLQPGLPGAQVAPGPASGAGLERRRRLV
jgi:septal ring factor EnvC (AmiA/AmiB activator)